MVEQEKGDEWGLFGSDSESEEEVDVNDKDNYDDDNLAIEAARFRLQLEKSVQTLSLNVTQAFIRYSNEIPLSARYFGLVGVVTDKNNTETIHQDTPHCSSTKRNINTNIILTQNQEVEEEKMWTNMLSNCINGRGIKILPVTNDYDEYQIFDCAAFHHVFYANRNKNNNYNPVVIVNNHKAKRIIRKGLIPGGFLLLSMHILDDNDEVTAATKVTATVDKSDPTVSSVVSQLLSMWKVKKENSEDLIQMFSEYVWDVEHARIIYECNSTVSENGKMYIIHLTKRSCTVNKLSCPWKGRNRLAVEHEILENATISPSVAEILSRNNNCNSENYNNNKHRNKNNNQATTKIPSMTKKNIEKAVASIRMNGFVILRNIFQSNLVHDWSQAILEDFEHAVQVLDEKHNVDVKNPGSGFEPLSYKEIAMREDLRVDLRTGPCMRVLRRKENSRMNDDDVLGSTMSQDTNPSIIDANIASTYISNDTYGKKDSLRFNPDILNIVQKVFNPHDTAIGSPSTASLEISPAMMPLYKGNFGRWNFGGSGPNGSPQSLSIGQVGAVVSLPGSADQAIHADTPHLFEHLDCLPCHYLNVFTPGIDAAATAGKDNNIPPYFGNSDHDGNPIGDNLIGGTAFVYGSHFLSVAARLTALNHNDFSATTTTLDSNSSTTLSHQHRNNETNNNMGSISAAASEKARHEMLNRVIRPSLQIGDAIMFDCRVLHFGLANQSNKGDERGLRRPMLYINMSHAWFHDAKNWDECECIF